MPNPSSSPSASTSTIRAQLARAPAGARRFPTTDLADAELSPLARLLASCDGTLTRLIAAWAGEPLVLARVRQRVTQVARPQAMLALATGEPVLRRRVWLHGRSTRRAYLHARALVAIDRLDRRLRAGLLAGTRPLGELLSDLRLETFRDVLALARRPAGSLAAWFRIGPRQPLLVRRQRIFLDGQPAIALAEFFPEHLGRED